MVRWAPGSSRLFALRRWLTMPPVALVALVAAAFFLQIQSAIPTIFDDDGYYHIKVAELTARNGILRSFPWAAFTPFRDHFGDKEFLFHVFLVPFTGLGLVQGAKLATVVLDAAIVALSYHLLRVRQVRGAPLWMLLFIGAGSLFFWRMGQCRPHLGSILFVLTGLHLMARRRPMALAMVAALYALAYTASHVILILAMLAAALHRRSHGRIAFELPLAALVGLVAGHLLHPNFPHNLLIWKIQNIDFYRFAWLQGILDLGPEIKPLPLSDYLRVHFLVLGLWLFIGAAALRRRQQITYETAVFAAGGVAFGIMAYTGARFTEYWIPLSCVALPLLANDVGVGPVDLMRRPAGRWALGGVAALFALSAYLGLREFTQFAHAITPSKVAYDKSLRDIAGILAREAPGEIVYHAAWSDSSALFLYDDKSRYLAMLDPIYFYYGDPYRYVLLRAINAGGVLPAAVRPIAPPGFPEPVELLPTLRMQFETRFVVARSDFRRLIDAMRKTPGVIERYRSTQHVLFELPR